MDTNPYTLGGRLVELSREECLQLVGEHTIGRLAWHGPGGPTVIPVNYAWDGHQVHVRTEAYSALARECDDAFLAFEVDRVDESTRTGWSVLLRGRCRIEYTRPPVEEMPQPWPAGARPLHLVVEPATVHGRRIV